MQSLETFQVRPRPLLSKAVCEVLYLLRVSMSLTQSQLAKRIHRPRSHVSRWEISRPPNISTLYLLARGLRVSVSSIILLAEARAAFSDHARPA